MQCAVFFKEYVNHLAPNIRISSEVPAIPPFQLYNCGKVILSPNLTPPTSLTVTDDSLCKELLAQHDSICSALDVLFRLQPVQEFLGCEHTWYGAQSDAMVPGSNGIITLDEHYNVIWHHQN